jgi:hypothetical protein
MRALSLAGLCLLVACSAPLELPKLDESTPYVNPMDLPAIEGLPELLTLSTGETVRSERDWLKARRPEIARTVEHYVYGTAPEAPAAVRAVVTEECITDDGKARREQIRLHVAEGIAIDLLIYSPVGVPNAPCLLGLNFCGNHATTHDPKIQLTESWMAHGRGGDDGEATESQRGRQSERWDIEQAIARGWAVATFYHGDVDPDTWTTSEGIRGPRSKAASSEAGEYTWGTLRAWAWGLSRALDHLVAHPGIDGERVVVHGHSRNGKTALVAGAYDQRFAGVISNHSGCGGAALSRPARGETVQVIVSGIGYWFTEAFWSFADREAHLPLDQHFLLALVAPRPLLVCSAIEDEWADPLGEFQAVQAAAPAWELFGHAPFKAESFPETGQLVGERAAYHVREGKHSVLSKDWALWLTWAERHVR